VKWLKKGVTMKINFEIDFSKEKESINRFFIKIFASVINQDRKKTIQELSDISFKNKFKLWICKKYWCC